MERSRKRRAIKYISFVAAALIAIVAFLYFTGQFGVSQADIEADARESQKIDESWLCVKASEDDVTAMLFYDEFLGDYKVSIYTNPADRPFGSFFLYGGTTNAENEGIAEYLISDSGDRVYMSMNLQNADLMKISGGQEIKEVTLRRAVCLSLYVISEEGKPVVTFYDAEGAETGARFLRRCQRRNARRRRYRLSGGCCFAVS